MKRRLALAVALMLAVAMVLVLASCGGGNNDGCTSHTYSTEYTTDANGHWYEANCGCDGEVANYGAHKDDDKNGNCDVCQYVLCAHTFADTLSSDENSHYYASTCECNPQRKDEAPHADANKDGVCDTCQYVVCSHEYSNEWSSDENNHWKAPSCDCEIDPIELGAHIDSDKNGNCDTCQYVICAHTYADTWSSDGAYHWYAATCGCNVVKDKAEHDGDADAVTCPTCGANICKHTYESTLSFDDTYHWYAATCGCDVVKDKVEHTWSSTWEKDGINHWQKAECGCDAISGKEAHFDSDDADARCDKCGQIDFGNLIGNIDEYIGDERNSVTINNDDNGYIVAKKITYYDNYILIEDDYGKKYVSYFGDNNEIPFVVQEEEGGIVSRVVDFDDTSLLSFLGVYEIAAGTTLEEYLIALYDLGLNENSTGFNYTCDEENSKYSFTYIYCVQDYCYINAVVEFTLDEKRMGVTSLSLNEERYAYDTYIEGGENEVIYKVTQSITQGFGALVDSSDNPNPYTASEYILNEFVLYNENTNEQLKEGDVITIAPGYFNGLSFVLGESQAEYASFNKFTVEFSKAGMEAGWVEYPVLMYAESIGTYDVTISNEMYSISFIIEVEYQAPTKINPTVVIDGENKQTSKYDIYAGLELLITATSNASYASPEINMPTVTGGDASKVTITKEGEYWKVVASEAGEYQITLVSALDANVEAIFTLTAITPPTAAEILNGYYEIDANFDNVTGSIKFIPDEAGASSGTAIFNYKLAGNPMQGVEDEIVNATFKYVYDNGVITLSAVEGDDITEFAIAINEFYELVLIRTPDADYPNYTFEYTYKVTKEIIPTLNPFTMELAAQYSFSEKNSFVFTAGEDGKYVFYLPKGYGLLVDGSRKIDYTQNESGFEFKLDLKRGQEVKFTANGLVLGEFEVYYYIEKRNDVTDANGIGGTYTFVAGLQFELTFTPTYSGATTGTLTVKDPITSSNSGTFDYAIEDGGYVFAEELGIYIYQDIGGYWFFQNPTLLSGQQFSGPTSYAPPVIEELPYNGYEDENELGGVYTFTVDGKEYKVIIIPSSDGGAAGKVQIYNPVTDEYSEAYDYTIDNYEYIIGFESVEIYRDADGSWLVKAEGLDGVKFADATVVPQVQEIKLGSNTITLTEKEIARGGKTLIFTPATKGKYNIASASLTIKVLYEGNEINASEVELEAGKTYIVVVTASEAKNHYLSATKDTSSGGGDGTVITPDEEL